MPRKTYEELSVDEIARFAAGTYALPHGVSVVADGVTLDASRARCEAMVRLSRERLLMEALARELSSLERVTVFDRAFDGAPAPTKTR